MGLLEPKSEMLVRANASALHPLNFWFNTAVAAATLIFDLYIIFKYWHFLNTDALTLFVFWVGVMFIIAPYANYVNIYRKFREFEEGSCHWAQDQLSWSSATTKYISSQVDALMACYLAAIFVLQLFAIRYINHRG